MTFNPQSAFRNPQWHTRPASGAAKWALATLAFVLAASPLAAASPADPYLYIPPWMADHVVFYHSFEQGPDKPEINLLGAKLAGTEGPAAPGLVGKGYRAADGRTKRAGLQLTGLALALHRPVTVSMWWRLDAPLKADSGFNLVWLNGRGYVSNFVRSGPWCGLKEPHCVVQSYNWPGVWNVNDICGRAAVPEGVWHHALVTISGGSQVCAYWDGALRTRFHVNGRMFSPEDAVKSLGLGPDGAGHPMTMDEILVLDGLLAPAEVSEYVTAVRGLAAMRFPVVAPDR